MHPILKESIFVFVIVVVSNLVVDLGEEEQRFFTNPMKFFGLAALMSVVGGWLIHLVKQKSAKVDTK